MAVGKLEAIWIKRFKGGPMDPQENATLVANRGIVGNADQGRKRQVTILSKERWDELMAASGANLDPATRRANLMVSGIELAESRRQTLQVGNVRIHIYNETRPCEQMDAALPGLRESMQVNWGGGAFGEVLDDGAICVGDSVQWISNEGN